MLYRLKSVLPNIYKCVQFQRVALLGINFLLRVDIDRYRTHVSVLGIQAYQSHLLVRVSTMKFSKINN